MSGGIIKYYGRESTLRKTAEKFRRREKIEKSGWILIRDGQFLGWTENLPWPQEFETRTLAVPVSKKESVRRAHADASGKATEWRVVLFTSSEPAEGVLR